MNTQEQEILQKRAQAARQPLIQTGDDQGLKVIGFLLQPEHYALDLKYVKEVLPLKDLTPIPGTPAFVAGVINYRGQVLAVNNLNILFGLRTRGLTDLNKIIVLSSPAMEFGVLCDGIVGNQAIDIDSLSGLPMTFQGTGAEFARGITADGLILLDAARMLSSELFIVNQK